MICPSTIGRTDSTKGLLHMDYRLWLLADQHGHITLNGWSETGSDHARADAEVKTDHWPAYPLGDDPAQLPDLLAELGLILAPGADLADLARSWDVYLQHPDPAALRTTLDKQRTDRAT